jgi:hypothetical protein
LVVMNVVSHCPLQVLGFVWQSRTGTFAQTVIVKATYVLRPGECVLAVEQAPVNEDDVPWDDDPAGSAYAPSDLAPLKPKAEVMLVGYAFAPGQQPARSVTTRVIVGELDKSIEVWCDRGFRVRDGQLLEGPGLTRMPLRWERAAGGPETGNPVGMRFDAAPDKYEMVGVPNLQPSGVFVSQRADVFAPVCFAPVAARWPGRAAKLGRLAGTFPLRGWEAHPLPEELDYGYFQAAPVDQQVSEIRPNERIVLENLLLEHPRLVTCLPGIRPRAVAERGMGQRDEVALVADTLWIDTGRGICTVVWRGRLGIRSAGEVGRIVVSLERGADAAKPGGERERGLVEVDLEQTAALDPTLMTMAPGLRPAVKPVMPFLGGYEPSSPPLGMAPVARGSDAGLPFVSQAVPFASTDEDVPTAIGVPRPQLLEAIAPAFAGTPWGSAAKDPVQALTVGQSMSVAPMETPRPALAMSAPALVRAEPEAPPILDEAAAKRGWKSVAVKSADGSKGPPLSPNSVLSGAASASDAAAAASWRKEGGARAATKAAAVPSQSPPKDVVELLWFDPAFAPRIRRQPAWKEIIAQIKPRPLDDDIPGEAPPEKRQEIRDRRDVFGVLARGEPLDSHGVEQALANAVGDDGTFVAPLVLVAGELELPFDEVETLKATIAAVTPLIAGDKRLKEAVDTARELLETPWLKGAGGIAEGLTGKIKDVFGQGNRVLPARYLEGHTERMLLEQRAYQKRTVLGKACIRGLLGMAGVREGVPMYFPDVLGTELPSFMRFSVKVLGEARARVDQYEGHAWGVRAIAMGRVLPSTRR